VASASAGFESAPEDSAPSVESDLSNESPSAASAENSDSAWRDELSARLHRYRARRKPQPPRYPSLRLRFETPERSEGTEEISTRTDTPSAPIFGTISNHALALDGLSETAAASDEAEVTSEPHEPPQSENLWTSQAPIAPSFANSGAKIIEFPRFHGGMPDVSNDELAEPVIDRPRILEVPETAPSPPALGGITIEAVRREVIEKRPGIDFPVESAPLSRRMAATAIDFALVAGAVAFFTFIFWKVTALRPPLIQTVIGGAALFSLLWAVYQYLLLVYSGSTPGLRIARLQLVRFDGTAVLRRTRRWRVFASYLSAASLCMGYVWVFLDENALCWHDRITRTCLASRKCDRQSNSTSQEN